ncbi:MAG TPA: terminase [bacterium]
MDDFQNLLDPWADDPPKNPLDDFDPVLDRTEKETSHHLESGAQSVSYDEMFSRLVDRWWRLNNLYYIIDRYGKRVLFRPNTEQTRLYDSMWYQNLILKARQRGFTTFIDLFFLDACLFIADTEAGIIAHNREDVSKIFRRKILYPYENLPDSIKNFRSTISKSKTEIHFNNNSIISVGTSMRSGTLNLLHVSEFGKVCARYPEKAREIVTGSFEAIHTQTGEALVFVESTAEGKAGYYYDYCKEAQDRDKLGRAPTKTEFKFHFFPWWDNSDNEQHEAVPMPTEMVKYFEEIEVKIGRQISPAKRYWYITKWRRLGEDMMRENPSTPEEAFENAVIGAYFSAQFVKIRQQKRICKVPYQPGISVRTWWDLGMNDIMAIWFTQDVGREVHIIDYFENSGEGFEFYAKVLCDRGYFYAPYHNAPHDIKVRELGTGASRWEQARAIGINFNIVPRVPSKIDSINAARRFLAVCWFDEEKCEKGIARLENYRKIWDENLQTYKDAPLHDENSNGADAFQTLASGHEFKPAMGSIVQVESAGINQRGWT